MNSLQRDYLGTIELISVTFSTEFWEEEVCYILNGDRDVQIKYQGGAGSYLKDLLIKSSNPVLQETLLKRALQNFLLNYRIDDVKYDFENLKKISELHTLVSLSRKFCSNDFKIARRIITMIEQIFKKRIEYKKNQLLDTDNFKRLYIETLFFITDFLPNEFKFSFFNTPMGEEYFFIESYFTFVNSMLNQESVPFSNSLIFLILYNFPIKYTNSFAKRIIHDDDILESIVLEYSKEKKYFGDVLKILYNKENSKKILDKLSEFEIDASFLISPSKSPKVKKTKQGKPKFVKEVNNQAQYIINITDLANEVRQSKITILSQFNKHKLQSHGKQDD